MQLLPTALLACASALSAARSAPAVPVSVFLLRHAETAADTRTEPDPDLSEAGRERAAALGRLLGHAGVTRLYASEFRRTRATLEPLATAVGLEVESVPAAEAARLVERLRALPPGSVAVVCGHSNTVPALVTALGGALEDLETHPSAGAVLPHDAFDRLALVVLPSGEPAAPRTIELRYGD